MVMITGTCKLRGIIDVDDIGETTGESRIMAWSYSKPEVFVRLYRRYYDAILRYCVHRLFERTTAEDVTSEVFLNVVENIHGFKGDEKQFRNWLYRIATNAINNYLRKTARRNHLLKGARKQVNSQVADCGESTEKLAVLREAVFSLKPRSQTIITLRFFENMKLTEIAEVLGSNPGTVRSQLTRALENLRKKISRGFQRFHGLDQSG